MKTNEVPMRTPEPIASAIPTERYWDGGADEDAADDAVAVADAVEDIGGS